MAAGSGDAHTAPRWGDTEKTVVARQQNKCDLRVKGQDPWRMASISPRVLHLPWFSNLRSGAVTGAGGEAVVELGADLADKRWDPNEYCWRIRRGSGDGHRQVVGSPG